MLIHLIRHGEVDNPDEGVYADIPGFVLSGRGREQAKQAGSHLASREIGLIVSSPLDRAAETAALIAASTGADIKTDPRLTEWGLATRWRGAKWTDLRSVFPGELEAYFADPYDLAFSPESLEVAAMRIEATVMDHASQTPTEVAFVSHQDCVHAAVLRLTGAASAAYHSDKPEHSSVTTLERTDGGWRRTAYWAPPQ